jgi:hypothetical protein
MEVSILSRVDKTFNRWMLRPVEITVHTYVEGLQTIPTHLGWAKYFDNTHNDER